MSFFKRKMLGKDNSRRSSISSTTSSIDLVTSPSMSEASLAPTQRMEPAPRLISVKLRLGGQEKIAYLPIQATLRRLVMLAEDEFRMPDYLGSNRDISDEATMSQIVLAPNEEIQLFERNLKPIPTSSHAPLNDQRPSTVHSKADQESIYEEDGDETIKKKHVFISYTWANSAAAIKTQRDYSKTALRNAGVFDPRELAIHLKNHCTLPVWIDYENISAGGRDPLFKEITNALNQAYFAVLCVSTQYDASENCNKELHYILKNKIPFVVLSVGRKGNRKHCNQICRFPLFSQEIYEDCEDEIASYKVQAIANAIDKRLRVVYPKSIFSERRYNRLQSRRHPK
ncbi:hypothetical protein BC829DRAFT_431917 [Chytridium lagenaria]|nr:hypothetical protein BC829DRAFT_431917 [Chytridium lagenaria]